MEFSSLTGKVIDTTKKITKETAQTVGDVSGNVIGKTTQIVKDTAQITVEVGNKVTDKTTQIVTNTGTTVVDAGTVAIDYTKSGLKIIADYANDLTGKTIKNAKEIANDIWQTAPGAGKILQKMAQDALDSVKGIATSPTTIEVLKECGEITKIVGRISPQVCSINALITIKKRTAQGYDLGSRLLPIPGGGAAIGAVLGASFGLYEVANELLQDPSLLKDIEDLFKHCQHVVALIQKAFSIDVSEAAISATPLPA